MNVVLGFLTVHFQEHTFYLSFLYPGKELRIVVGRVNVIQQASILQVLSGYIPSLPTLCLCPRGQTRVGKEKELGTCNQQPAAVNYFGWVLGTHELTS